MDFINKPMPPKFLGDIERWPLSLNPSTLIAPPSGHHWKRKGDVIVLTTPHGGYFSMEDWLKIKGPCEFTSIEDAQPTHATREEVMALVDMWPIGWNTPSEKLIADGWIWAVLGGNPVIINQTSNINSGTVITEREWREYKNQPIDPATAKQPTPKGSGNPILGMVLADLTNRALEGKEKYGEPLLAHNGRNPLWDAYQEALDLAMYLRQAIEEQKQ